MSNNTLMSEIKTYAANEGSANVQALDLLHRSLLQMQSNNPNFLVALMETNLKTRFKALAECTLNITLKQDAETGAWKVKRPKVIKAKPSPNLEFIDAIDQIAEYVRAGDSIMSKVVDAMLPAKAVKDWNYFEAIEKAGKKLEKIEDATDLQLKAAAKIEAIIAECKAAELAV